MCLEEGQQQQLLLIMNATASMQGRMGGYSKLSGHKADADMFGQE